MPIPPDILSRLTPGGLLSLHVIPNASRNEIIGWTQDAAGRSWLKIRINATPEDGKANRELLKFLAKSWRVSTSSLLLVTGETSRHKKIRVCL